MQSQQDDSQRGPFEQPRRAALYVRVSTSKRSLKGGATDFEQDPAVQEMPLRALVAQRGWHPTNVYSDRASGAKERRPGCQCRDKTPAVLPVLPTCAAVSLGGDAVGTLQ
jgi:hypothetical protein